MKARLWFVHRGVERLFEGRRPEDGIAIAERISGDTAVGHSVAFAMAVEEAAGVEVSDEDRRVRALLLELERIHNHVADLGALANDVGYGLVQSHALRLREGLMRVNAATTGHRLLRDGVTVGGARLLSLPDPGTVGSLVAEATDLAALTLGNATVRDRFTGTSVLSTASALRLGVLGYVARASGVDADARRDHAFVDIGPGFAVVLEQGGDVLSRFRVRVRELEVSAAVVTSLVESLAGSTGSGRRTQVERGGAGLGLVEGWRGLIAHRVELDGTGAVSRAKVVDPSFFNWPALPVALADTIVPDFPLTNKSFNQSYAGNDL
jgi:Ni,Fe-hydrogenase III large subunit